MAWLATRAYLFVFATTPGLLGFRGDVLIYQRWYDCCFAHAAFPAADAMWQYPPGAAVVFWLPGALPGSYLHNFVFLALACDLAVTVMLARRSQAAAWYWVCAVPLVGPIALTRFDEIPVALSVTALCLASARAGENAASIRGVLIGVGVAVKIWPVALLVGTPPGQWRRTTVAAATAAGLICVLLIGGAPSFLGHQNGRGLEIESVAATPLMIWRLGNWHGKVVFQFGAMQLDGRDVAFAEYASLIAMGLAVAVFAGWRLLIRAGRAGWRPEFATDAPLAATLVFLVTNSVLSPQYLLWAAGLAAACLAAHPERTTQRPVAVIVLAAAALTQVVCPIGWKLMVHGSGLIIADLALRNALLLVAAVLSCSRILRESLAGPQAKPTREAAVSDPTREAAVSDPSRNPEPQTAKSGRWWAG